MTRDETKQILMRISTVYPNYKPVSDLRFVVETWNEYLAEYSYEQVKAALQMFIVTDTSGFAPSIGQLIEKLSMISKPEQMGELKAWTLVSKAVRNSAYNSESEFEKLPPLVQKALGSAAQLRIWAMDEEYNESVNGSNFMRTYRAVVERENKIAKMPAEIRNMIQNNNRLAIEGD